jgi:hypothetical protein
MVARGDLGVEVSWHNSKPIMSNGDEDPTIISLVKKKVMVH